MIFWRVKPLDQILETASKKSLKRQLGAFQLTMLGIGAIIGTGIFVLSAVAANLAGPGMMISFVIAATVCALAALCYAELASMVPVSGSAYTYSYAVLGELVAWVVGWALILEYAVAASAVSVGWSGYVVGLIRHSVFDFPQALAAGPLDPVPGVINLPAVLVALGVTGLLVIGTSKSAAVNAVLVAIKILALTAFIAIALPASTSANFQPFLPTGFHGVFTASATIFFAYVGFDAVSTAAEETKDPRRTMPIGIIGSLGICTVFYLLIAAAMIGSVGAQPGGELAKSAEPLAFVMRAIGWPWTGNAIAIAAGLALPSVILMMIYGQTRIFFVMSRDGLLPEVFSKVHPKFHTPHVITLLTGIFVATFAGLFPLDWLADISNAGTLFAFFLVSLAVLILRKTQPNRYRPFSTPWALIICPLAMAGCAFLFFNLKGNTELYFLCWAAIGLVIYYLYGRRRSHLANGTSPQ
ncbi:MAG: amino acid permease [Lysobacterales bacterium]